MILPKVALVRGKFTKKPALILRLPARADDDPNNYTFGNRGPEDRFMIVNKAHGAVERNLNFIGFWFEEIPDTEVQGVLESLVMGGSNVK
jgi:hypothetical protein